MEKERVDAEALLRHKDFVRGLALKLVFDEHRADDVVQETWLAALENAPARPRSLRAWLARVARNLALRAARTELRRTQRETRAARPDRAPPPRIDAVERLARERKVVDAVLQLEEPYRTVVVLRYYEDLKPGAIAQRLDENPATVRTRLKRGLERLRGRLDGEFGSRRAWGLALVPLLVPPASMTGAATVTGGIIAMSAKSKTVLAACVLLAALLGLWWTLERSRATPPAHAPAGSRAVEQAETDPAAQPDSAPDDEVSADRVRVTVRVVEQGGGPVPDALVDAVEVAHMVPGRSIGGEDFMFRVGERYPAVATAPTGADGRAVFDHPYQRTLVYVARKAGRARKTSPPVGLHAPMEPPEVTLVLERGFVLAGRVTDAGGRPVEGALVLALPMAFLQTLPWNTVPARAVTGADGTYRFDRLEASDTGLWTALPGGVPYHVATVRVPAVPRFDIVLERGGTVTGVVTDAATGGPVAGAAVRVLGYFPHRANALTDEGGRYVVETLPPTQLSWVKVAAEGYTHLLEKDFLNTRLGPGEAFRHDVALRRGTRVFGTVRGGGRLLPDVLVTAYNQSARAHRTSFHARTDARGRYEMVLPAVRHRLLVTADRWSLRGHPMDAHLGQATGEEPNVLDVPETAEHSRDIELEPVVRGTAVLAGRVENPDGTPVAHARVFTAPPDGVMGVVRGGVTYDYTIGADAAADGAFRIEGVFAGEVRVLASAPRRRLDESVTVHVRDGEERTGLVLRMLPPHRLTGTVRGPDGPARGGVVFVATKPNWGRLPRQQRRAWAHAWAYAERVPVRPDGRFETEVSGSTRFVRAVALDHARSTPREVRFDGGDLHVDIVLARGRTIEGVVADKSTRAPVAGALVHVLADDGVVPDARFGEDGPGRTVVAVTDESGAFTVHHLPDGPCRVQASAPGYTDLALDADTGALRFELEPSLAIRGTLLFPDGTPAAGLRVYAIDEENQRAYSPGSSPTGTFVIEKLKPGRYRIVAGGTAARTITTAPIEAGRDAIRLRLERAGPGEGEDWPRPLEGDASIGGRVLDLKGRGIGGVRVYGTHADLGPRRLGRSTRSAPDGSFTIRGLRDGPHRISVAFPPQDHMRPGPSDVATGRSDVELRFGVIAGRIRDRDGQPLAQRKVEAVGPEGQKNTGETDAAGRFRIGGLDLGVYRVALRAQDGVPHLLVENAEAIAAGTENLDLVAITGATITGRVEDETGRALEGVLVLAEGPAGRSHTRSGKRGAYRLSGLVEGAAYVLKAWSKGRVTFAKPEVRAPAEIRVVLPGGRRTTGRLLDRDSRPVGEAQIRFQPDDDGPPAYAKTDKEGRFDAASLRPDIAYRAEYWPKGIVLGPDDPMPEWIPCGTVRAGDRGIELRQR